MGALDGRVALVAGATRGAGRGIACELGAAGATVYCTGRSSRADGARRVPGEGGPFDLDRRPETIEETAELVDARGGRGIAVRTDHTVESEVEALVERLRSEEGRLDVLVNDIWGGDELTEWGEPFWEVTLEKGRLMLERAVFSHIITARHAAPLMLESRSGSGDGGASTAGGGGDAAGAARGPGDGLIVEVTDGDTMAYRGNVFYDLVKTSVIRLALAWAAELAEHGIASVAVTPGFLRSEAMLDHFGVTESNWRDAVERDPHFAHSETPFFAGRAVAALASDPEVGSRSGRVYASWTLAREYGFTDVDGRRPDWGAHMAEWEGEQADAPSA
ncbi:MAG: SDR family NAD(P)-dependent oxidoreductase [Gemmatimonadota bacterium]